MGATTDLFCAMRNLRVWLLVRTLSLSMNCGGSTGSGDVEKPSPALTPAVPHAPYQDVICLLLPGIGESFLLQLHHVLIAFVTPVLGTELIRVGAGQGQAGVNLAHWERTNSVQAVRARRLSQPRFASLLLVPGQGELMLLQSPSEPTPAPTQHSPSLTWAPPAPSRPPSDSPSPPPPATPAALP